MLFEACAMDPRDAAGRRRVVLGEGGRGGLTGLPPRFPTRPSDGARPPRDR